jgi:hypothetical protein
VVGGGVAACVARAQQYRERFPGAVGSVVDERAERMESVSAFVGGFGVLLIGVRGDQGRVEVDDQRRVGVYLGVGACFPAAAHTRARVAARAVAMAFKARGASAASAATVRDTVGSDATRP